MKLQSGHVAALRPVEPTTDEPVDVQPVAKRRCPDCYVEIPDDPSTTSGRSSPMVCHGCGLKLTRRRATAQVVREPVVDPFVVLTGETLLDCAWRLVKDNPNRVDTLVRAGCRAQSRPDLFDDCRGESLLRIPAIVRTYDSSKGSLWCHVSNSLYWYARKAASSLSRPAMRGVGSSPVAVFTNQSDRSDDVDTLDNRPGTQLATGSERSHVEMVDLDDTLKSLLGRLPSYDRWILHQHYVMGFRLADIAAMCNPELTYSELYSDYRSALALVRSLVR